jgi:16S rRNA (guanine527-N7)-methyltransferase
VTVSPEDVAGSAAASLGLEVRSDAAQKLARYVQALGSRGVELGVVGRSDVDAVLPRHVLDSLRGVRAVRPGDRTAYDLGSGGGLPGIPIAIVLPELGMTLVESRRLRAAWLEAIVDELSIPNASVVHGRIDALRDPVNVCFARALGPLDRSWALARPLLRPGGRLAYFAGAAFDPAGFEDLGEKLHIQDEPDLESGGPLVIIERQ